MELSNSICVITGVNSATGLNLAQRVLAEGAQVVGTTRPRDKGQAFRQVEDRFFDLALDPLDTNSVQKGLDTILTKLGAIHVWVNVVGGFHMGALVEDAAPASWDQMLAVNFRTVLNAAQIILPHFKENQFGRLINFGSAAVARGMALAAPYLVSKAAVQALTKAIAAELHGDITCNAILPTIIDTAKNREAMPQADFSSWISPDRIADSIIELIQGKVNGELIVL